MKSDTQPEVELLDAYAEQAVMPEAVQQRLLKKLEPRPPASWVSSAYFAEGIPFALVAWVAGTMFKDLGYSDAGITVVVGSIGVTWSLKPLWAAFLDMFGTKRLFVLATELAMAAVLAACGIVLQLPNYFPLVVTGLWVLALASATHDICVDGIYMSALDKTQQARWVGTQSMFWNGGRIFATSGLVYAAARLKGAGYSAKTSWLFALAGSALMMLCIALYHHRVLPTGSVGRRAKGFGQAARTFADALAAFVRKPGLLRMLAFVALYRLGEGFLLVEAPLFLQASRAHGGLGLGLEQKALLDGMLSTLASISGALAGGAFVAKYGLKRTLLFLALCLNLPHVSYLYLAHSASHGAGPSGATIVILVCAEKFGYSFGFVGNVLYMMQQLVPGRYKMTHYALATALMNLALVPTQMLSGPLAIWLGYPVFFGLVLLASIPSVLAAWQAPFPNPPDEERPRQRSRLRLLVAPRRDTPGNRAA